MVWTLQRVAACATTWSAGATLGNSMESAIHALSIQTYTRDAWEKARKFQTL